MKEALQQGTVLMGKYKVERVLGEGGMGVVVAATHLHLQERVALKFLLVEVTGKSDRAARFMREAQAAVKIKSEHVARVTDVGTLDSGAPYMVMEYLEGEDLEQMLAKTGALPPDLAVEYVHQACIAIAEAHKAGIIHRDLKPANLFATKRTNGSTCIKVLDFGISKMAAGPEEGGASLTKTSGIMGSPAYMSPEQLRATRDVDARTDIWSLGVMLHELLTGKIPFDANSVAELCAAILTGSPPNARTIRADLPEGLEHVVMRCLKKDPNDRFQTVDELIAALDPYRPALTAPQGRATELSRPRITGDVSATSARPEGFYDTMDAPTRLRAPATSTGDALEATTPAPKPAPKPPSSMVGQEAEVDTTAASRLPPGVAQTRRTAWIGLGAVALLVGGVLVWKLGFSGADPQRVASASAAPSTAATATSSQTRPAPVAPSNGQLNAAPATAEAPSSEPAVSSIPSAASAAPSASVALTARTPVTKPTTSAPKPPTTATSPSDFGGRQ